MRASITYYLFGFLLPLACLPKTALGQNFCDVDYILPDTVRYCAGDSVTVDIGSLPDTLLIQWSTGSDSSRTTFTAPGTYLLVITNTAGTCQTEDDIVVLEDPFPVIDYQTSGRVCAGDTLQIFDASQVDTGGFLQYTLAGTPSTVQPGDTLRYPAFPGLDTSAAFVTAISPLGCTSRDTFDLLSFPNPTIDYQLAPEAFCFADSVLIIDRSTVDTTGTLSYTLNSQELIDMVGDTFDFRPAGFDLDTARIDIRAQQYGCTAVDSLFLIPLPNPEATIAADPEYCLNEPAVVDITVDNTNNGFSYVFSSGESGDPPQTGSSGGPTTLVSTNYDNAGTFDYGLVVTLPNGCSTTYSGSLSILDFVAPQVQGVDANYCADGSLDTLQLFPPGGMTTGAGIVAGSSTDTSVVIRLDTPGSFQVGYSYTAENGCSETRDFAYQVNALPEVDLGPDTALFSGETIVLQSASSPGNYAYLWSTGVTTPSLTVSNPGFYVLRASIASSGCTAADTIEVIFANPVFDFAPAPTVRVFPNPTTDVLRLDVAALPSPPKGNIRIWDAGGRPITAYPAGARTSGRGSDPVRIDLPPGIPAGLYWLSWGRYRARFVVLRQ